MFVIPWQRVIRVLFFVNGSIFCTSFVAVGDASLQAMYLNVMYHPRISRENRVGEKCVELSGM